MSDNARQSFTNKASNALKVPSSLTMARSLTHHSSFSPTLRSPLQSTWETRLRTKPTISLQKFSLKFVNLYFILASAVLTSLQDQKSYTQKAGDALSVDNGGDDNVS